MPKKDAAVLPVVGKRIEGRDGVTTQSGENPEALKPAPRRQFTFSQCISWEKKNLKKF